MSRSDQRLDDRIRSMPLEQLLRLRLEPLLHAADGGGTPLLAMIVAHVERALIAAGLDRTGGRLGATAALLGIHRNTLRLKLRELGFVAAPRRRLWR